jgi:hypothetical protein
MIPASILRSTGQLWKMRAFYIGFAISGALMFSANLFIEQLSSGQFTTIMLFGVVLALSTLVFAINSIKCPNCHARWFWMAISKQKSGEWLNLLENQSACPVCTSEKNNVT